MAQRFWIPYILPDVEIKAKEFGFFSSSIRGSNKVWFKTCPCFDKLLSVLQLQNSSDFKIIIIIVRGQRGWCGGEGGISLMSIMKRKFLPYRMPNTPSSLGTSGEQSTVRAQPPFPFGHRSVCHKSGDSLGHKLHRVLIAAVLKWFFEGINHSQLFQRCVCFGITCCCLWWFSSTCISYKDLGLPKPKLATKACSFLLNLWEGNFLSPGWNCWILKETPIEWLIQNYTWWDARFYSASAVLILEDPIFIGGNLRNFGNLHKVAETFPALG